MAQPQVSLYEGLFLLNQQEVAADLNAAVEYLQGIFNRADAQVVTMKKWGERKLAYPIKGQKRGVYILVYSMLGQIGLPTSNAIVTYPKR